MKNLFTLIAVLLSFSAFCQGQLQKEATGFISFSSGKVMQLAEAVPEEKYTWSPQAGVRSFADVFKHIISANYFFGSKLGATIPAGVKMETLDMDLKTKADIKAALKQSYDFILAAVKDTKDENLAAKVEYPFPGEFTNMSSVLIALAHSDEHLGQLIAYSRVNGIKPPWSE
ncbi:MAG TPA: DinB family protein [Cyclobacteriaceae bacterium]|nr:DinB family protein [Cyclobacteriaceae bacterium]